MFENADSAGRRTGKFGAATAKVGLVAAEKRVDAAVAIAACQRAGPVALSEAHHGSPEDAAVQVGAVTQFGQGVPAADESPGLAAVVTGVEVQTVAAVGSGRSGNGRPAVIALELAVEFAAVGIGSSCVAAAQDPDRVAARVLVEGLVPTVERIADIRLRFEVVGQLVGSSGIDADSSAVVVVVNPDVGRGCSDLPRPASGSYLRY